MSEAASSENPSEPVRSPHEPRQLDREPADIVLSLTRSDRLFLSISGGIILLLMGVYLVQSRQHPPGEIRIVHSPENELALRLDINTATWVEWMQMEGIGEGLARSIVADREMRGAFRSVDDVSRVRGIGDATMAKIRPYLQCRDCATHGVSSESGSQ